MNKKIILLILVLPLLLMFGIYTTSSTMGLNIKAPVTNIAITGSDIVYLNFDNAEKYYVNYTIYPVTAKNKQVTLITEQVGSEPLADLTFEDGYIVPKSIGMAKVYLKTVDGGFMDSFIVKVDSINVQSIECSVTDAELMVGTSTTITTNFLPANAVNKLLSYSSSNTNVARVDDDGVIRAVGKGSATITITSEANAQVYDIIQITVLNQNIIDLAETEVYTFAPNGSINISVDTTENYELTYEVYDQYGALEPDALNLAYTNFDTTSKENALFNYTFAQDFFGSIVVKITITTDNPNREPFTQSCIINRVSQMTASFDSQDALSFTAGAPFALHNKIAVTPQNIAYHYEVSLSNDNVTITEATSRIRLTAVNPGVTTITIKVISDTLPIQTVTLTKEIIILPTTLQIVESAKTYGIENLWTIGSLDADGNASNYKINLSFGNATMGQDFLTYFNYTTDNPNVTVAKDGTISIDNDTPESLVKITGKFEYKGASIQAPTFTIRCIGGGVNVDNFADLYTNVNNQKVIVLQNSIKEDFGKDKAGNDIFTESTVTKITSTYDTTYYKNANQLDNAKVKVLLNIKNDMYGNGYQINAHNVAYGLDSSGTLKANALFKGPLNFVSTAKSGSNGGLVSVKAQDNISFGVYENVTLNNITLTSCDIQADGDGNYDLTDLTYVGTTVEVLGDNVNITHSRINNGRTVLRVFGDIADNNKVIHLNIANSVLSGAREFIVRMGSNAFVDGSKETPSPYLDDNNMTFPAQKAYSAYTPTQKTEYDNKYIKTFVNIKNSILKDSALFCIGIDSHFAGSALADGSGLAGGIIDNWKDLAKTSYGAKLTFEGDVRMYDWKLIDRVDSSTLIETEGSVGFDLSFDVRQMITMLANSSNPKFNTIIHNQNGKQYVHGGIAFFGGGKNYGVFENKDYTFKVLNGYEINFADINKVELQVAAGVESFYFMLNDTTTQGFLPDDQETILGSTDAYAPIYN